MLQAASSESSHESNKDKKILLSTGKASQRKLHKNYNFFYGREDGELVCEREDGELSSADDD